MQRNGAGTLALYAAAAAGGGTAQWLLEAANTLASYDPRTRRGPRSEGPWDQEAREREGRDVRTGGGDEEPREPWVQLAASAMGLVLPILWQAVRELTTRLCGRPRAREDRARRLEELDSLAREVLVAGAGAAAVIATDQGVRTHELIAWAESWTASTQGPLTYSRIAQPEIALRRQ